MDASELRETVRRAINQSRIDNDRVADTAAIVIRIVAEACAEIAEQIPPAPKAKTPGLRNAHFAYGNGRKDAGRCIRTALIRKEPNNG